MVSCGNNVLPRLLCVQLHPKVSRTVSKGQNSHHAERDKKENGGEGKRKEKKEMRVMVGQI